MIHFKKFVESGIRGTKFIACCDQGHSIHLKNQYTPGENATIIIGPEGDFSQQELDKAKKSGFNPVSLGNSRLRTETAGVVATSIINLLNG
jgi:16S rRNA (uracil1498-N3)-methyltransferase